MALNFPNSPTDGQIYTDTPSGNRWVWDNANTVWKSTSTFTQTITVSSTAPGSPVIGQLWWNQDYGRLLVYYNDGTSSQWVDASPSDYTSALAYAQSNAVFGVANAAYNTANTFGGVYGVANAAFGVANTALQNTSVTLAGDLTITGNTTIKKKTVVNYTPATTDNAAVYIASANTQGGTGYADFLKVSNIAGGTNPNKTFRLNSTGGLEIINSAYTANIFTITDAGYVTTPYQPAFRVEYTGGTAFSGNAVIIWNSVIMNDGSGYSNSTGRFTAPVAGRYLFSVSLLAASATGVYGLFHFRVNGTQVSPSNGAGYQIYLSNSNDKTLTASPVIKMNAGDYLDVYIPNPHYNFYPSGYNSFSGILLG